MKRVSLTALLLVFLNTLPESEASLVSPKPSDELKELRDIIYQQGTSLVQIKTEVKYVVKENEDLKAKMVKQLKLTKQTVKRLDTINKEMSAQLSEVSVIRSTLANSEAELAKLKKENEVLKKKVLASESDLQVLRREVIENPKVAFSAGLTGSVGPLGSQGVVTFTKVITNSGSAYNPSTGMFTAPVGGVYYFRFTACGSSNGHYAGVSLYKNQERLTHLFEYNSDGYARHFSGGVTASLSEGDTVSLRIPGNYRLYEDSYTRNIFSGFLLFPTES